MPRQMPLVARKTRKIARAAGRPTRNDDVRLGALADWIGFHLRLAQDASFRAFAKHSGQPHLKPGRFAAMMVIHNNPGITQTALGRAISRDKSTVTPLVQELHRHGLVRRRPSTVDRRSVTLTLDARRRGDAGGPAGSTPASTTAGSTPSSASARRRSSRCSARSRTGWRSGHVHRQHRPSGIPGRRRRLPHLREFRQRPSGPDRGHRRGARPWRRYPRRHHLPQRDGRPQLRPRPRAGERPRPGRAGACGMRHPVAGRRRPQRRQGPRARLHLRGHVALHPGRRVEGESERIHPVDPGRAGPARHRPPIHEVRKRAAHGEEREADRVPRAANRPQRSQRAPSMSSARAR